MILKYIASSGNEYDLKSSPLRTRSADFHEYQWDPNVQELQYGDKINRFGKRASYYTAVINIEGTIQERKDILNILHQDFEKDIQTSTPGRIVHGDYYIECYITFSNTAYTEPFTENQITIYCPYPFWIKENVYEFERQESTSEANEYLDFDYDFEYDFMSNESGQGTATNEGAGAANFRLIIFGPAVDPIVSLDDRQIGAYVTVAAGEYLTIDSRTKTVIRTRINGTKVNDFNNRVKSGVSIFDKISSGKHNILWPGTYGLELTIFEERSEPEWS